MPAGSENDNQGVKSSPRSEWRSSANAAHHVERKLAADSSGKRGGNNGEIFRYPRY